MLGGSVRIFLQVKVIEYRRALSCAGEGEACRSGTELWIQPQQTSGGEDAGYSDSKHPISYR